MESTFTLTSEQQEVLRSSGMAEKRLEAGELRPVEYKMLMAYEEVCRHLSKRYPGQVFTFAGVDNALSPSANFTFHYKAGEERFAVKAICEEGGYENWQVVDSYYSILKKEELAELVQQTMAGFGLEAVCDLQMNGWYDESYQPEVLLKDTLSTGLKASVFGWVYIREASSLAEYTAQLEKALCSSGLCGGFRLVLLNDPAAVLTLGKGKVNQALIAEECYLSLPDDEGEVR